MRRGSGLVIRVRAQGHLKHFRADRQERFDLELDAGATVRSLIERSGIPWEEVGLVAVNGVQADDERILIDGDEVTLLAPMEGG
jgi:molybdopterin converting factor small subunit